MLLHFLAELNETDTFDHEDDDGIQFKDSAGEDEDIKSRLDDVCACAFYCFIYESSQISHCLWSPNVELWIEYIFRIMYPWIWIFINTQEPAW